MAVLLMSIAACSGVSSVRSTGGRTVPGLPDDLWKDAPVGSWVRQRQVIRVNDAERSWEGTFTRVGAGIIAEPSQFGGLAAGPYVFVPSPGPFDGYLRSEEAVGTEAIVIGRRKFSCEVIRREIGWGYDCARSVGVVPEGETIVRLWRCAEAPTPGGVLQWEASDSRTVRLRYTAVNEDVVRQGRRVTVLRFECETSGPYGASRIEMEWSPDVPGGQLSYRSAEQGARGIRHVEVQTLDWHLAEE